MLSNKTAPRVKKLGFWGLFWASPLLFVLIVAQTLGGYQAAAAGDVPGQVNAPNRAALIATSKAVNAAAQTQATPTPNGVRSTGADTLFTIFLPIIFKAPAPPTPVHSIAQLFGPVLNPGAQAQATFGPTVNPPPPVTPTPSGPVAPPGEPTYTPTPKASLTPTNTPTATPQIVPDGDFDGSDSSRDSWRGFSLKGYELFFDDDADGPPKIPGGAFSGNWAVWLGGDDNEISYIEKSFVVPNNRTYVGHVIKIQSYDSVCATELYDDQTLAGHLRFASSTSLNEFGVDLGGILVSNGPQVQVTGYDLCNIPNATGWGIFAVPLIGPGYDFRGQTVNIQIKAITDGQLSSSVFVDDVVWLDGPPTSSIVSLDTQLTAAQLFEPQLVFDTAVFGPAGLQPPPNKVTLLNTTSNFIYHK